MSESAKKFLTAVSYWKMALLKCACQCVMALGATIAAGLNGVEWHDLSGTQKFVFASSCVVSAVSVINAFCSTTMADLQGDDRNSPPTSSINSK